MGTRSPTFPASNPPTIPPMACTATSMPNTSAPALTTSTMYAAPNGSIITPPKFSITTVRNNTATTRSLRTISIPSAHSRQNRDQAVPSSSFSGSGADAGLPDPVIARIIKPAIRNVKLSNRITPFNPQSARMPPPSGGPIKRAKLLFIAFREFAWISWFSGTSNGSSAFSAGPKNMASVT